MPRRHIIALSMLATSLFAVPLRAQNFGFEDQSVGTVTPFSSTVGGLTAMFSSPDGGPFSVEPSFFIALPHNVLLDADPDPHALLIHFSRPLTSIALTFALNGAATNTLTLTTLSGATVLGSATATGSIPIGRVYPEGFLVFTGAPFDNVRITATTPDFAVDDITVRAVSAVPEPATLALVLPGVVLLGLRVRRRRA